MGHTALQFARRQCTYSCNIHVLLTHLVSDHVLHGDLSADDVLVAEVPDGATKPRLEERGRQREEGPPRVGVRVHAVVPRGQAAHVHVGGEVALSNRVPQGGRLQFRDDGMGGQSVATYNGLRTSCWGGPTILTFEV